MNRSCRGLLCAILLFLNGAAHGDASRTESAHEFSAKVIAVLDGDTVLILRQVLTSGERHASGPVKIRLAKIDAPEKEQAYGMVSRSTLVEMVLHKQVRVHTVAVDKYGRSVAQLEVGGLSVNEEMVRRGMAWEYSHFHNDRRFIALEMEARQAGRGLWAQRDPMPPWQWRKRHVAATGKPLVLAPGDYTCGSKHRCVQMRSCDEAHFYLTVCGVKGLNPQGDGVPCGKLCTGNSGS